MRGKKCEVSASEMMEMRREGLSNKDIAELLEISVPTVHKYIGKQGGRMERLAVFADKGKKKQPEAKEEICETKKTNDEAEVCAVLRSVFARKRSDSHGRDGNQTDQGYLRRAAGGADIRSGGGSCGVSCMGGA